MPQSLDRRSSHHTPPEEFADCLELVPTPRKRIPEEVVLISALDLRASKRPDVAVRRRTRRALGLLALETSAFVQTALMEGVFAEKMDGRELKASSASCTSSGLEDGGFGAEIVHLFTFGVRLGAVGFNEAAVVGDVLAFLVDGPAEVFFNQAHGCDAIGGEGLNDLEGCYQTFVVDFLQDRIKLVPSFFQCLW